MTNVNLLEVGAIIWPKKKTIHMKFFPICVLSPLMLVCFLCVTKQQMLVQVFCVLQYNSVVSLGFPCVTCNTRKIYL